jgi:hypothetical protein
MLSIAISSVGIVLELLLIFRGHQQGLLRRYPLFFTYISFVLVSDVAMVFVRVPPQTYLYMYWIVEFLGLVAGCLIVFEFYRVALRSFPGTARVTRALLAILFLLAMIKTVVSTLNVPRWWFDAKPAHVEGALRVCELLAILSLVVVLLFYSIPIGKNLRGILLGYSVFVSWSVICLALVAAGVATFDSIWSYTYPFSYLIGLVVWTVHLWSYQPNPVPDRSIPLEQEYQRVAAATQRRLHDARGYLAKAVGS